MPMTPDEAFDRLCRLGGTVASGRVLATLLAQPPATVARWVGAWEKAGKIVRSEAGITVTARLNETAQTKTRETPAAHSLPVETVATAVSASETRGVSGETEGVSSAVIIDAKEVFAKQVGGRGRAVSAPVSQGVSPVSRVGRETDAVARWVDRMAAGGETAHQAMGETPRSAVSAAVQPEPPQAADEGRFEIHARAATIALAVLGAALSVLLFYKGWGSLQVTLAINTWYAGSLGTNPQTKALFEAAFVAIGYLAAFGPASGHTLWLIGQRWGAVLAGLASILFVGFGIHASMGFVATNTDAATKARDVFLSRLAQADSRAKAAQETLDRIGVVSWTTADQEELDGRLKGLPGRDRACTAAKPAPAIADACQRIAELREERSNVGKVEAAKGEQASAAVDRKAIEAEAAAKGVTLGTDADPVALKVADHVQAITGGWVPLTPRGVAVAGFFFEALAPEFAVLVCFWLGGALGVAAAASLFKVRRRA